MTPNRIAIYFTALAALATALAPVLADLDTTSTAGLIAGLAALAGVVGVWLRGWQRYEDRLESTPDEELAEPIDPEPTDVPRAEAAPVESP